MPASKQSFDDLEKQLARDALEQALKDLHGVINKEIENNKVGFSQEIQKTLASFKQNLEKNVSEEIDKKLSSHRPLSNRICKSHQFFFFSSDLVGCEIGRLIPRFLIIQREKIWMTKDSLNNLFPLFAAHVFL